LDEERVALHLKTLLNLIKEEKFGSMKHTAEMATLTFEVRTANFQERLVHVACFPLLWYLLLSTCCHHILFLSASLLVVVKTENFSGYPYE